jgi:uncharacterized membrane protein
MASVLVLTALLLVFGGLHVGLATRRVRDGLVSRLGEPGFRALFSLIAAVSFSVLVHYYTVHRFNGPPGLALGAVPALRWTLMAVVVAGIVLIVASLVVYPRSPMAVFNKTVEAPQGIERVTRHGLFVGTALLGAAHALLATRLVGAVLMGGLAVVAVAGAWHQDRKFLRQRGEPYGAYLEATSMVPFGAIVAGRQRLAWRELPVGALALGVGLAVVLRTIHGSIFAHGGAWVSAGVIGGAALAGVLSARRVRRRPLPSDGSSNRHAWAGWLALFFIATALGHALVGIAVFHEALAAIVRDGFVNGVHPQLLERGVVPYFDREAAFWFILYTPILVLIGLVTRRALEVRDVVLLRFVGWTLLATGGVGAVAMPISGFWIVVALGWLVLRAARREVRSVGYGDDRRGDLHAPYRVVEVDH